MPNIDPRDARNHRARIDCAHLIVYMMMFGNGFVLGLKAAQRGGGLFDALNRNTLLPTLFATLPSGLLAWFDEGELSWQMWAKMFFSLPWYVACHHMGSMAGGFFARQLNVAHPSEDGLPLNRFS